MILKLFEPAYYTKNYGLDVDIKKLLIDLSAYYYERTYSSLIDKVSIIMAIAPEEMYEKGLLKEFIKCWPKSHDCGICIRLDFDQYHFSSMEEKQILLLTSILISIKKIEKKQNLTILNSKKICLNFARHIT